jgi:hypothetical protein
MMVILKLLLLFAIKVIIFFFNGIAILYVKLTLKIWGLPSTHKGHPNDNLINLKLMHIIMYILLYYLNFLKYVYVYIFRCCH